MFNRIVLLDHDTVSISSHYAIPVIALSFGATYLGGWVAMRFPKVAFDSRSGLMIGAALVPILIVLVLPIAARWGDVVPLVSELEQEQSVAPEILSDLSSDMTSIALAIIVGAAVLLREWRNRRAPKRMWIACILVIMFAAASCYAGIRFRFAVAEQILFIRLNLDLISDRLTAQGAFLLIAFSPLV